MSVGPVKDEDGLPLSDVGPWVHDKHTRLRRYIDISSSVRAKFIGPGKAGATYIDLYCGPGRSRERTTGKLVDGSAIVAALAAEESGQPFSEIHLGDTDGAAVRASAARLHARGVKSPIYEYIGRAENTVTKVKERLNPFGLHVAFLDPFGLADLPFAVIHALGGLRRPDLLVHVSAMDLQRNLRKAIAAKGGHAFDTFAPGWRETVDMRQPQHAIRRGILNHWMVVVRADKLHVFGEQLELVSGPRNQRLYWLAFAAKHERASEFWEKIRHINPQGDLPL